MIEYARRSQEAGVLVSQAMLGPEATEITLDGDRFSTKELEGEAMGYAYIEAESFADAVRHVKEFLQVAGGGRTVIRQVMDADAGRGA